MLLYSIVMWSEYNTMPCINLSEYWTTLDFKGQFADSNESISGQIKLQRLFFRKPGFFCQRHKVKCINFGEIPSRSEIGCSWSCMPCEYIYIGPIYTTDGSSVWDELGQRTVVRLIIRLCINTGFQTDHPSRPTITVVHLDRRTTVDNSSWRMIRLSV